MSLLNRKEYMKRHGLTCTNNNWSWVLVNHTKKYIVVQKPNKNSKEVYNPTWGKPTQPSHNDFKAHLDLVKSQGYSVKMADMEGYVDENDRYHIKGYHKEIYDAELVFLDGGIIEAKFIILKK